MHLCVHLKIEFVNIFDIDIFKNKESYEMSAEGAHVQKMSERESTNSPVLSSLHSSNIDAEYVFFLSTIIILDTM